jgi:hypothetical protein
MNLAEEFRAGCLEVLTAFGGDRPVAMVLRQLTPGTYDPATGGAPTPTTNDYDVIGTLLKYSDLFINGTTILREDRKCIISAVGMTVAPKIEDRIIADGITYAILEVETKEISGIPMDYVMQVRRGAAQ